MRVIMKQQTFYDGPRKPGDIVTVPESTAQRWIANGIAEPEMTISEPTIEEVVEKTAKELYQECIDAGLEVEPKKSKAYYLEALKSM